MPTRDVAPSDLKDPEVTQQNLPKGETWDENEWATDSLLVTWKIDMMADRWKDQSELKERHLTRSSVLEAPRKGTSMSDPYAFCWRWYSKDGGMSTAATVADGGQDVSTTRRKHFWRMNDLPKLKAPEEDGEFKPS